MTAGCGPHFARQADLAKGMLSLPATKGFEIELAGEPKLSVANFVSGLKAMPIRYRMR